MKSSLKFLGFITLIAVFGFSMITCDEPAGNSITIIGDAKVGQKITATSTGSYTDNNYYWFYCDTEVGEYIRITGGDRTGPDLCEITIPKFTDNIFPINLAGKYIKAGRYYSLLFDKTLSDPLGPIVDDIALSVSVNGSRWVGQEINAYSEGSGFQGDNFSWEIFNNGTWENLSGATGDNNKKYIIKELDVGKYIRAYRRSNALLNIFSIKIVSNPIGPITATAPPTP